MKIVSWNINGIRAISGRGDLMSFLNTFSPDVFAMQETKIENAKLTQDLLNPQGYKSYFHSALRPGYSGVGIYTKKEPLDVLYGIGENRFDNEGRVIGMDFGDFILFNVYFPNGGSGEERLKFKLEFYDHFLKFINNLRQQGRKIIIVGDFNTAHHEIDLARPKENQEISGFMPIERVWIDKYLENGFVDTFRYFHPDKKDIYSWWSFRTAARQRNIGWRIDYQMVSDDLKPYIKNADILSDVFGSDHCPVSLELGDLGFSV